MAKTAAGQMRRSAQLTFQSKSSGEVVAAQELNGHATEDASFCPMWPLRLSLIRSFSGRAGKAVRKLACEPFGRVVCFEHPFRTV